MEDPAVRSAENESLLPIPPLYPYAMVQENRPTGGENLMPDSVADVEDPFSTEAELRDETEGFN